MTGSHARPCVQGGQAEQTLGTGVGGLQAGPSPVTNCYGTRDEPPAHGGRPASSFRFLFRRNCLSYLTRALEEKNSHQTCYPSQGQETTLWEEVFYDTVCPWGASSTGKQT